MLFGTIVRRLRELGEGSSLHGLPKIVSSPQVVFKIFWTIIVIGASMLLGLQLDALYQEYTKYPTKTSITMEYGTLEFPSVTICNMNPIKRSKLDNFPNASDIIRGDQQSDDGVTHNPADLNNAGSESPSIRPPDDDTITRTSADAIKVGTSEAPPRRHRRRVNPDIPGNNARGTTERTLGKDANQYERLTSTSNQKSESARAADPTRDWNAIKQQFLFALREANQSLRLLHGHTKNDLFLMAMFSESALPLTYMEPVLSAEHGTCYTVNVDKEIDAVGPKAGLKLVLLIDKEEYIQEANDGYGMKVIIHGRGTFPMSKEEGIVLNQGYLTSVGMRRKTIERYGPPYSQCIDGKEFKEKYGFEYSNLVCLAVCRSEKFWENCGCIPHLSPEVIGINTDRKVCPLQDSCIRPKAEEVGRACNCLVKCKEHVYESRITSMRWPSPDYLQNTIYGEACYKNISSFSKTCEELKSKTLNFTDENYRIYLENFASLHIFYDGLVHETITEEPLYSTIAFLSDIGGSMSLFLGASLITYLELIHLLVELLICLIKRCFRKSAIVVPEKSTNVPEKKLID